MVETVTEPRDWAKVVAAAFAMILSTSVREASAKCDVPETTIHRWMRSDFWADAKDEARSMVPQYLEEKAIAGVSRAMEDPHHYASMSKFVIERLGKEFAGKAIAPDDESRTGLTIESEKAITRFLGVGEDD